MTQMVSRASVLASTLVFAGCAALPADHGDAPTRALVESRVGLAPAPSGDLERADAALPTEPLSVEAAIRLAFVRNPRIQTAYANLGLGRAELEAARRIANPSVGYSHLDARDGPGAQIAHSVAISFADLLLLPSRKRLARAEFERLQQEVAAELLELASEVEVAWYEHVGARHVAAMREAIATAAEASAVLARRFFAAGNITRLQLAQEEAAATTARIAAARASADALRARHALAAEIGVPASAAWTTVDALPAPVAPDEALAVNPLVELALAQRLDLAAAHRAVALREDALGVTRRWRWLGAIEIGYEREGEPDDAVVRGPTLELEVPLFDQGQARITRAQAELLAARAELDQRVLAVHNEARLGVERLSAAYAIAERYRTALVPQRETIVRRTQEQVNFMLVGIFELVLAKQEEYDAYQEYLEAVRDYWTARAELKRVVGGRLPGGDVAREPAIGVDAVLPSATPPPMDHGGHGQHGGADPHAGHRMPATEERQREPASPTDPHAGHRMPTTEERQRADPHAGHRMPATEERQHEHPSPAEPASREVPPPRDAPEGEPESEPPHDHHEHGDTP